jgi:ParB family chromosome partitioning protein
VARKNLLEHLMGNDAGTSTAGQPEGKGGEPSSSPVISLPVRKPAMRGVGVVGAMSESLGNLAADLKAAQEQAALVLNGDTVIEISTDLIDPSFVSDRLGDGDVTQLTDSITKFGQQSPILVRPHPERKGRYQTAFGHRRVRVLRSLGLPAKAVVRQLTDEDLVIAQGQENQRRDLSFIERALFASRLEGKSFTRDVICSALYVDKTELSRLLSIITALPAELIDAIGPALKTGRRKWLELAALIEPLDWNSEREQILNAGQSRPADSDAKFELILQSLRASQNNSKLAGQKPDAGLFSIEKKRGVIQIRFDENKLPKHLIDDCVAKVRELCDNYGAKKVT